jgi:hypothetical protein
MCIARCMGNAAVVSSADKQSTETGAANSIISQAAQHQ